jgi:hypothetical protein
MYGHTTSKESQVLIMFESVIQRDMLGNSINNRGLHSVEYDYIPRTLALDHYDELRISFNSPFAL